MNNFDRLQSSFKDILILYVKYKQSQGYKYSDKGLSYMYQFDKALASKNITSIDDEFINTFCDKKENEKATTTLYRQCMCKNLCSFIKNNGYPETALFTKKYIKYTKASNQYIYTKEDINKIFNYLNNECYICRKDKHFHQNLKMIISLLYATGMRSSEVTNLKRENINYNNKTIDIILSKNNRSRTIPISNSVFKLLCKHINDFSHIDTNYVFIKENMSPYDNGFQKLFRKILVTLDIKNSENRQPRIHDFRFTFAVLALNKMVKQGMDIYCTLPILQVYLGHANITSTEYYLKYTDFARNNIIDNVSKLNSSIFGVYHE